MHRFYAFATHASGIYHFATEAERDQWIAEHAPYAAALDRRQVDPEIVADIEAAYAPSVDEMEEQLCLI